jgi:hypothetical protein
MVWEEAADQRPAAKIDAIATSVGGQKISSIDAEIDGGQVSSCLSRTVPLGTGYHLRCRKT